MPAAILNKQPIFTATPILISIGTDVQKNTGDTYQTNKCTNIYVDTSTYGSLVTKITVKANAGISYQVTTKRVDLYISSDNDADLYDLYQSMLMRGSDDLQVTDEVPSVVFEFPEGLILKPGKKLAISATENTENSSKEGDRVAITLEGGTYDQPA